jgi:hypothetical protein
LCKREFYQKNKIKILNYHKQRNLLPKIKAKRKLWNKEHYFENKEKYFECNTKWREKNKDKINNYAKQYNKQRYDNDVNYKISEVLRSRFWQAVNNNSKTVSVVKLVGISIPHLKDYLKSKFKKGMAWDNYGKIWEIDHILPCSSFNLSKSEEQEKCFHFSNLQPLFKTTKISKSLGYNNEIGNRNKYNKITPL